MVFGKLEWVKAMMKLVVGLYNPLWNQKLCPRRFMKIIRFVWNFIPFQMLFLVGRYDLFFIYLEFMVSIFGLNRGYSIVNETFTCR